MKMRKRIGALLLSLGMLVSIQAAAPAGATEQERTSGSITVHKFEVKTEEEYNSLKNNVNHSGNIVDIEADETLSKLRPMEGISFTLTRVEDKDDTVQTPGEAQAVGGKDAYTRTVPTNAQGLAEFKDLSLGLYKLEELDDGRVKYKMDPVLISIPTYNQDYKDSTEGIEEFNYDIHVYPKNLIHPGGPDIQKDVDHEGNNDASVNIGQEFDWIILGEVPEDITEGVTDDTLQKMYYRILDNLDPKLDFVKTKSVILRSADKETQLELKETEHYKFTRKNDAGQEAEDGRKLTWELTTEALKAMKDYSGGQVVVTFTTKLNDTAKESLGQAIENKAELEYKNTSDIEYKPESDKPEVHTGGVKIKKVDKAGEHAPLEGAEFKIYKTEVDAKAGKNAILINGNEVVKSDAQGIADFYGLAYYTGDATGDSPTEGSTTYWVVETKAPMGTDGKEYNRLKDPFEVTVTHNSHDGSARPYKIVYNAKNNYELPFTGGTGLLIFLGGGAALLLAAYVISRKGKNKAAK